MPILALGKRDFCPILGIVHTSFCSFDILINKLVDKEID